MSNDKKSKSCSIVKGYLPTIKDVIKTIARIMMRNVNFLICVCLIDMRFLLSSLTLISIDIFLPFN